MTKESFSQNNEAIIINPTNTYTGFEGWGTSLAWWGHIIGQWPEKKMDEIADLVFDVEKGLGLNIVRYNIGGGENPKISKNTLRPGGDVPSFQPEEDSWDVDADYGQRTMLLKGIKRGVNIAEAFSNSPPYWMTESGSVTGAIDGGNNLKEEYYKRFADYLTEVVKIYKEKYNVEFRTLNPLNEPISNWWKKGNIQEGCHFSLEKQIQIIRDVYESLKEKGITYTTISASDENSIDETINVMGQYDIETMQMIAQINTHSYSGSALKEVKEFAEQHQRKLWMSEYGTGGTAPHSHEDMTSVMELAKRIIQDLRILQPDAWVYWQAVEDEGAKNNWGFIHADFATGTKYEITKQFYAMANFSRFIRPGHDILLTPDDRAIAAYNKDNKQLVIVVRNNSETEAEITFDLRSFVYETRHANIYQTSASKNLENSTIELNESSFSLKADPISVTTIVIEDMYID